MAGRGGADPWLARFVAQNFEGEVAPLLRLPPAFEGEAVLFASACDLVAQLAATAVAARHRGPVVRLDLGALPHESRPSADALLREHDTRCIDGSRRLLLVHNAHEAPSAGWLKRLAGARQLWLVASAPAGAAACRGAASSFMRVARVAPSAGLTWRGVFDRVLAAALRSSPAGGRGGAAGILAGDTLGELVAAYDVGARAAWGSLSPATAEEFARRAWTSGAPAGYCLRRALGAVAVAGPATATAAAEGDAAVARCRRPLVAGLVFADAVRRVAYAGRGEDGSAYAGGAA